MRVREEDQVKKGIFAPMDNYIMVERLIKRAKQQEKIIRKKDAAIREKDALIKTRQQDLEKRQKITNVGTLTR